MFLCVVDPGVGGTRPAIIVEADRHWHVGPGSGWFELVQRQAALLEHGARVGAVNNDQLTPLALALQRCSNAKIREIAAMAELLLKAQPRAP